MQDKWINRWKGMGPYYAMFPHIFAIETIEKYSKNNDIILDPFAGRGTSIFAAAVTGRKAVGIEINPVGWVFGQTKIDPANKDDVLERVNYLLSNKNKYSRRLKSMPEFFHFCYSPEVLKFLLAARDLLKWETDNIDRTLMSFILVDLHGKRENSLSNQMRQTKSMSPQYSVNWWKEKQITPPDVDVLEFFKKKIDWRYKHGFCDNKNADIIMGDNREILSELIPNYKNKVSLILTSPPYFNVTNYFYDQWLRLWVLGGDALPKPQNSEVKGKFNNKDAYCSLLYETFSKSKKLLKRNGVIYVRTDSREFTLKTTYNILKELFPNKTIKKIVRPTLRTQTNLFDPNHKNIDEVDIILI